MAGPTATPYISFEVAEKSKAANPHWIDSGIMRDDNTWLYVQGNYHLVMVFGKEILRMVYKKTYAAKTWEPYPTIRTFLMPMTEARKIALKVFEIEPIDTAK